MHNDDPRNPDRSAPRDPYRQAYGERYYQNQDEAWPRDSESGRGRSSEGDFFRGRDDEVERRRSEGHLSSKKWPLPSERDRPWGDRDRYSNDPYASDRSNPRPFGDRYYGGNESYSGQSRGYEDDYRRSSGEPYGRDTLDTETGSASGPYAGRGPKGYRRSDQQIIEEACQRLERDGRIDATDIEVTAESGVIRLEGSVATREEKRRAEECVDAVYGVRDVMNQLRVTPRGQPAAATQPADGRGSEARADKTSKTGKSGSAS